MNAIGRIVAVLLALAVLTLGGCNGTGNQEGDGDGSGPAEGSKHAVTASAINESINAAAQYLQGNEPEKAEAILARLVERAPNSALAHEEFGKLLLYKGTQAQQRSAREAKRFFERASEEYQLATELDADNAGLHQSAGEVALMAGQNDRALDHFEAAATLDESNPKPPLYAAQILLQQGAIEEARTRIERVLTLDPDEPYAYATQATILKEVGEYEAAIEAAREARSIEPQNIGFRVVEARIHRHFSEPDAALQLLLPLTRTERAEEAVTFEIAAALEAKGEYEGAAEAWVHRAQRSPGDWRAALHAGQMYLKAGQRDVALVYQQIAAQVRPDAPEVKALEVAIREDASESKSGR